MTPFHSILLQCAIHRLPEPVTTSFSYHASRAQMCTESIMDFINKLTRYPTGGAAAVGADSSALRGCRIKLLNPIIGFREMAKLFCSSTFSNSSRRHRWHGIVPITWVKSDRNGHFPLITIMSLRLCLRMNCYTFILPHMLSARE